jgi:hypothetical protein
MIMNATAAPATDRDQGGDAFERATPGTPADREPV